MHGVDLDLQKQLARAQPPGLTGSLCAERIAPAWQGLIVPPPGYRRSPLAVTFLGRLPLAYARAQINALIVDAPAPERLGASWSVLLDRPVVDRTGPYAWLQRRNGTGLGFPQTAQPKPGKNRMHFDISSSDHRTVMRANCGLTRAQSHAHAQGCR
ncbi:VOC family protein [Streptomyces sp. NBC_01497]|uniref:VOC family protein n=1 Tax=Streptomyces sp. NBC_01497 TaxID=2903885 RepID=UPI002E2F8CAF|nr:VOC family protein [Streptomyces sp. NBC_01497]